MTGSVHDMDRDVPFVNTPRKVFGPTKMSVQRMVGPLPPRIKRLYREADNTSPAKA
jgi:hypothetical protein